jgi:hypothetical protein
MVPNGVKQVQYNGADSDITNITYQRALDDTAMHIAGKVYTLWTS